MRMRVLDCDDCEDEDDGDEDEVELKWGTKVQEGVKVLCWHSHSPPLRFARGGGIIIIIGITRIIRISVIMFIVIIITMITICCPGMTEES